MVAAILNYYQSISFDFPEEFKLQCITMQPTEPPGKPSIANGYLDIYKACCDYFKLRPNSEFMFHIEDLVDSGSIDLDLSECPGLDFKSLGFGVGLDMLPIMVALHHNTYFRGVVIRNAFGRKEIFHLLADVLKVNTHITKVKLNDVSGEEKGFYDLVVALKENKGHSVQILDLRGNSATNKGATMLGETLKSFPHALRMLNLARCNIASKGIVSLIAAWEENFGTSLCLEELDLSENSFDKAGSAALESWMSNVKLLSNLRVLRLSNSNLVVNVIPSLHSLRNLVELDLSGNKIDSGEGCRIIGFVCDHIPTLQVLRISRCQITKDGIEIIADSICRNSELKIITLDISDNIFGDKGASILANKLNKVNPIQFLNISGNKMKPRTFEELAQACSNLQSLNTFVARRIFSLITHKIPPAASNMISSGLHKICERVKELDIAEGYGKTVLVPIFESLATNTNLKSLNVSCNGLGDKGIEILCAALRKNSSLTQLNVDDNKLTLTGFKILQKLFVRNTNLLTHTYPRGEIEKLITTLETPQKKELHFMTSLLASRLNANELISNKNFDQQLIQLCIYGKKDDTIPTPTSIKPREIIPEYLNQRRTTLSPDVVPDRTTSMERIGFFFNYRQ